MRHDGPFDLISVTTNYGCMNLSHRTEYKLFCTHNQHVTLNIRALCA